MRRRALLLALVAAAVAAAPARAADSPSLAVGAGVRFPDRAYAVTLPRAVDLSPFQVDVRENGRPVAGAVVQPADGVAGRRFGVVLAIDTSTSMRGRALKGAVAAARAFVAHRTSQQPIALVGFGGEVRVLLPFTTDAGQIDRALDAIAITGGGSRVIDAAARSVGLVQTGDLQAGSVVLLSDGADRGSNIAVDRVRAISAAAGVRVYTVGLRSRSSDFGALNVLAASTGGEFSETASMRDLSRVYGRLGSLLAHQYILRYRSAAAPSERVRVEVRVDGFPGIATTSYSSPAAPKAHSAPFHHSPSETVWLRPGATLGASIFCVVLLALGTWALLRPRGGSVRSRVAGYVGAEPDTEPERRIVSVRVREGAGRSLNTAQWMASLREKLDVGRISVPAERLVGWVGLSSLAMLILLPLITGVVAAALLAVVIPLGARAYVEHCVRRQRRLFTEQLPDNLQVMASAMRAGHSFTGALTVVSEDAPEPTRAEFQRVIADERLGIPVDQALAVAVRRMDSKELEQVALVAALQRDTGGNTAEVLERVTETVRERVAVRRMVKTLTAQGRMSRWVLTAVPVLLLLFTTSVNPDYVRPLYTTPTGQTLLVVAGFMVVMGSLVIKRIVDIKV
jgi:tight adherence protein B